ncbi:MAG: hypothetical protein V4621_07545 [Pseudomonadota bacterium]
MKLIDEWRGCLRFLSVQANVIGIAISTTYATLYSQLKENFPPTYMAILTGVVFVAGIVGRLISQSPKAGDS